MLFIFPAGVLAIRFFQEYASFQKEIKECNETLKKQKKQKILGYLVGFAISFSLTLTVHFYNTMPAGVLCLGIAVGFCSRFCRWRYFWRIIVTGLLSIVEAAENAPLSAPAVPRSRMRSGIAMRRRRAESGNSASRNAISLKSPSNRAEASMRSGSSTFLAAPSAVNATCPGEEMSKIGRAHV